ncbi:NAD(P)-dependent alcohol dehydrogenase [Sphaerisporangium rubeum]|uniref:NADPH:quinone reductase-like Zn-dependent oxidoreductase n=1 Tax=Sphaerisporangium rubeum TaxID=321317 RepID=A0A7X0IH60_9ACTN|nr:NAD(P)-dependent alcohol dehydrogenase [Sphaerisporangium rubeum]MBB6473878.1 NADPH:quinone reductase-like Zn-dependent oxidoreductase [Sphaerisporangium rubeum]
MKAFVLPSFGSPDKLTLTDVPVPVPGDSQVLVRVHATSVNPYDWHHMRGEPYVARLMGGFPLRRPKFAVLGADVAGVVEAIGKDVTGFSPGDEVYALAESGGFGEYACVEASELAHKPENLSFEQAASVPLAGGTALLAVRDVGRVRPGHKVLVNGASGGVGTFAVQLARAMGAEVTGVCGPRNVDLVRSIGADHVIDYTEQDFTQAGRRYDVVIGIAGNRMLPSCRRALTPDGTYVIVGGDGGRWLQPVGYTFFSLALGALVSQRVGLVEVIGCPTTKANLDTLTDYVTDGRVTPVIDRVYPFEEIPDAVRYVEQGHVPGKVVVKI